MTINLPNRHIECDEDGYYYAEDTRVCDRCNDDAPASKMERINGLDLCDGCAREATEDLLEIEEPAVCIQCGSDRKTVVTDRLYVDPAAVCCEVA